MRELKISLEEQRMLMRHEDIRTTLGYGGRRFKSYPPQPIRETPRLGWGFAFGHLYNPISHPRQDRPTLELSNFTQPYSSWG
jgi:hypothetical protein